jgi:hypothetical protein
VPADRPDSFVHSMRWRRFAERCEGKRCVIFPQRRDFALLADEAPKLRGIRRRLDAGGGRE